MVQYYQKTRFSHKVFGKYPAAGEAAREPLRHCMAGFFFPFSLDHGMMKAWKKRGTADSLLSERSRTPLISASSLGTILKRSMLSWHGSNIEDTVMPSPNWDLN